MRPFRFLATVDGYPRFAELTSLARKAEAVGCSTFVLPDHLIGQYAAIPLLAVVAAASERLRVGTFVLNACLRHPAVLAQDLTTLDVLSGGRLEIGLGAGWNKPEHDAIGIPFEPVGVRIKRLTEAITILKAASPKGRSPSRASTTPSPATTARPSRRSARTRRSSWAAAASAC
ncbi:MAG TPA: LLM class flavin-dependent oxidoreductase [Streptosporangiaceae bacterium]|nr:LLM class flavin-dependent oxidoreductase [Streptosporangiaceae bacterium]